MGAKGSFAKGTPVLVKVADGRGGHTLQAGTVKDTAGKGAIVKFKNGGHERFCYATELSIDTTEPAKPVKVAAPAHFEPKPLPTIGALFRAERVSRELTVQDVAGMLQIDPFALTTIEDGGSVPDDDLLLKFVDVLGANFDAIFDARDRTQKASVGKVVTSVRPEPAAKSAAPVLSVARETHDFVAIDAWVTRLRKLIQAIGTFKHDNEIVLTHRIDEANPWKVHVAGYGELGKTAGQAMGKLTTKLESAIADHIATRRKELADLESLSAAASR
jgi:transcriptional regulator with XRE-family HTH domain